MVLLLPCGGAGRKYGGTGRIALLLNWTYPFSGLFRCDIVPSPF